MGTEPTHDRIEAMDARGYDLGAVTRKSFTPKAKRAAHFDFGAIATTDVCNLECVMCHFNGPNATKKNTQLPAEMVRKAFDEVPAGSSVFMSSGGDLFMDPDAEAHIAYAISRGLLPMVQSHGQLYSPERLERLLAMGVRQFWMSCDTIDPVQYAKIRRGGDMQKILDAVAYINTRRETYPGIAVHIGVTTFRKTLDAQESIVDFWRGKVDFVDFNAEYYDTWKFRNVFNAPSERGDCKILTFVQPNGSITPCCAIGVHAHENELDWLPNIRTHTLEQAYQSLCDLYDDPNSPLGKLCGQCDWWILWTPDENGRTPYMRSIPLPTPGKRPEQPSTTPTWKLGVRSVWNRLFIRDRWRDLQLGFQTWKRKSKST